MDQVAKVFNEARPNPDIPAPLLSLVIPVRNEADNVLPLIEEIGPLLDRSLHQIVFVDDGSIDQTWARLLQAQNIRPELVLLRHRTSCGQTAAVITGIKAASGTWISTLDGDGQNDPADVLPAHARACAEDIRPAARRPILVAGYRTKRRDPLTKRLASRIANAIRAGLLGDQTPDTGCGLKVFRRDAFLSMPQFDHMHRFLPALFLRAGGQVISVPVNHRPRLRGRSKYGTWDRLLVGLLDLFGVWWLMRRTCRPDLDS